MIMQEAISYRTSTWVGEAAMAGSPGAVSDVEAAVTRNPVIVFGRRGCCMCHVVKRLLHGHGVNPTVFEVDEGDEAAVTDILTRIAGVEKGDVELQFPVVFVGGKMFGGLEKVIGAHITGDLVSILRDAGALWL